MRHITETQTKWRQSSGRPEVLNVIVASCSLLCPMRPIQRTFVHSYKFQFRRLRSNHFCHRQRFLQTWRNAAIHRTRFTISTTFINNNNKHSLSLHPSGDIEQTVLYSFDEISRSKVFAIADVQLAHIRTLSIARET